MRDWGKKLLGLAAIGGAIAGAIYYFKKIKVTDDDAFDDDFEDEDFDLDEDLKPVTDREYVSLTPAAPVEEAEEIETSDAEEYTATEEA